MNKLILCLAVVGLIIAGCGATETVEVIRDPPVAVEVAKEVPAADVSEV